MLTLLIAFIISFKAQLRDEKIVRRELGPRTPWQVCATYMCAVFPVAYHVRAGAAVRTSSLQAGVGSKSQELPLRDTCAMPHSSAAYAPCTGPVYAP